MMQYIIDGFLRREQMEINEVGAINFLSWFRRTIER